MLRKDDTHNFLNALQMRVLNDAPIMIKHLDSRRFWDSSFEVTKFYEKSEFTPYLDQRIENLKEKRYGRRDFISITGDGDAWSVGNDKRLAMYRELVESGVDIKIMMTEIGAWTIGEKSSARRLHDIGVHVRRVEASREYHSGVIGGEEMYTIHRFPVEGASKVLGKPQKRGKVNYTFVATNHPQFVKHAQRELKCLWKNQSVNYDEVLKEEQENMRAREDLLRLETP
ncbi:MAG: hypothetical protein GTN36_04050 [Candidatus Aenigmarchaeota archaeon]|nr:hypothetical protein [Candidatus Aenigmarchaeota archaeon]